MKKLAIFTFLLLVFAGIKSNAQTWAPLGAEWYYSYNSFWFEGFVRISSVEDTIIDNINCRKLVKENVVYNHLTGDIDTNIIGSEYMYSDADKVYIYINNQFYTLYDFSATIGDAWIIPRNEDIVGICNDEGEVMVVDTGHVNINGQALRKITVESSADSHWSFIPGDIIEKIGPGSAYMLPEPTNVCVVDVYEGGPLRCYSDDTFGTYSTGISEECDYLVSIRDKEMSMIHFYPNPCNELLTIDFPDSHQQYTIKLFDVAGREIYEKDNCNTSIQINMTHLFPGVYVLSISYQKGTFSYKIIKKIRK